MTELMDRYLPKWAQMIVKGNPVTKEQAEEIIKRTDSFFSYPTGNNHSFIAAAKKVLHLKESEDFYERDATYEEKIEKFEEYLRWKEAYLEKLGYIETAYVTNSWISCAYIGGPHGWCHPNGEISFVDNIGKYPSVREVYEDWEKIAQAFPFLDLGVTIYDGEGFYESDEEEPSPVVSMRVKGGKVEVLDPKDDDILEEFHNYHGIEQRDMESSFKRMVLGRSSENAIPLEVLIEWGKDLKEFEVKKGEK